MDGFKKRISIDDIAIGMFVEDVFNNNNVLLLSSNSIIASQDQIETLKRQGVRTLFINISKGKDVGGAASTEDIALDPETEREEAYYLEIEKAHTIRRQTVQTTRETLEAIRKGRSFSIEKVDDATQGIVESILRNPDALLSLCQIKGYDEYTYTHSVNVSILSTALALSFGYSGEKLLQVGVGGMLHDIGKMRIPECILNKPGKYTDIEFNIMKRHPLLGIELVKKKKGISDFSKSMIVQHHERFNGKGYPQGLKGSEISETGLISMVADVYDALTSHRVYRQAWTPQKALAFIYQGCDNDYSRVIVETFTKQMGIYPVGSFVRLISGEMGVVTKVVRGSLLKPVVLILFGPDGKKLPKPFECDLSKNENRVSGQELTVEISLNPGLYNVNVADYIDLQSI